MHKWCLLLISLFIAGCGSTTKPSSKNNNASEDSSDIKSSSQVIIGPDSVLKYVLITKEVKIKDYFPFMDKLIAQCDTFKNWHTNEYILVHANPWILDSLRSFDYYNMLKQGVFVYDQTQLVILHQGDSLAIPDSTYASHIQAKLNSSVIDVNIPEFTLRFYQENKLILTCPVRVGKDAEKFLFVVGHQVNLRTPIGIGEIVRIARIPAYINLNTGKKYEGTHRDDGKYTKMPIIPWIEPSINGIRYGAMIHPTTNPETLGKAYSHGCVGTTEADAWTIYYNSPIGTKVIFRYDLQVVNEKGDTLVLDDVYHIKD